MPSEKEIKSLEDLKIRLDTPKLSEGITPKQVALVFRAKIDGKKRKLSSDTQVEIKPALQGRWQSNNRRLESIPNDGFKPNTEYQILLKAVAIQDKVLKSEKDAPRTFSFKTPPFALKRVEFLGANKAKKEAKLRMVFNGPVSLDDVPRFGHAKIGDADISSIKYTLENNRKVNVKFKAPSNHTG